MTSEVEKVTDELDELGSSWAHVHHRVLAREAAALIRRLRDERDEARAALDAFKKSGSILDDENHRLYQRIEELELALKEPKP